MAQRPPQTFYVGGKVLTDTEFDRFCYEIPDQVLPIRSLTDAKHVEVVKANSMRRVTGRRTGYFTTLVVNVTTRRGACDVLFHVADADYHRVTLDSRAYCSGGEILTSDLAQAFVHDGFFPQADAHAPESPVAAPASLPRIDPDSSPHSAHQWWVAPQMSSLRKAMTDITLDEQERKQIANERRANDDTQALEDEGPEPPRRPRVAGLRLNEDDDDSDESSDSSSNSGDEKDEEEEDFEFPAPPRLPHQMTPKQRRLFKKQLLLQQRKPHSYHLRKRKPLN